MQRTESSIARLSGETFDVLVVGGGIVGSGVARDAAMRGLRVALIDQYDFGSGTSSRSSRLLHGGLRYLEQGRVGLVREASLEKKILHRIAPHLARPLGFVFPAYRGSGRPLWQLRIGVKLYDLLCNGRNLEPSRGMGRDEVLKVAPHLRSENLTGAAFYFDALTNDVRLVIDNLRSAEFHGAVLSNYAKLQRAQRESDCWECEVVDGLTSRIETVKAKTIVNATGPWSDQLPQSQIKLRLSKGIHLVVDAARLPVQHAIVITEGKRILFVIPWGQRVIVGTTDTDYAGRPEDVATDASDIAYVLETMNSFFPALRLETKDILSVWAGLRPLIANPDGSPSGVSRAHQIVQTKSGWWDIAGGKLTTYRLMAEQTIDQIQRFVGVTRNCRTAAESLVPDQLATGFSGIEPPRWSLAAVDHYVCQEWGVSLEDVMVRRSGWHYLGNISMSLIKETAERIGHWRGWTEDVIEHELSQYADRCRMDRVHINHESRAL